MGSDFMFLRALVILQLEAAESSLEVLPRCASPANTLYRPMPMTVLSRDNLRLICLDLISA